MLKQKKIIALISILVGFVTLGFIYKLLVVTQDEKSSQEENQIEYATTEWVDLIPKDELQILLNPPAAIDDIVDGGEDDDINKLSKNPEVARYQRALVSKNIVPNYKDKPIMIPGFIVPLEFDDQKKVTEFFLVPYFGACIHLPPPPPNQVIHARYPQGIEQKELYQPYWISGALKSEIVKNDTATSAYSMLVKQIRLYTEEDDRMYNEMQQEIEQEYVPAFQEDEEEYDVSES
tara:strand:- start:4796 stop:5497 length:702 start_codon:yes stop_codon:yes gene_type:complete